MSGRQDLAAAAASEHQHVCTVKSVSVCRLSPLTHFDDECECLVCVASHSHDAIVLVVLRFVVIFSVKSRLWHIFVIVNEIISLLWLSSFCSLSLSENMSPVSLYND